MLAFKDARRNLLSGVAGVNSRAHLKENGALVVVLGHSVDAESGFRLAGGNHRLVDVVAVHPVPAVGRQQRGMNIVAMSAKRLYPGCWNRLEVARQHQGRHALSAPLSQQGLVVLTRNKVMDWGVECAIPNSCGRSVGPNSDRLNGAISPKIEQGRGIASATRNEDCNFWWIHGLKVGGEMHHISKDWLFFAPINNSKPLVMSDIAARVQSIIVDKLGVPESEVTAEASFTGDLGADSLDTVELIMEFEKEFDIQIPDDQAEGIQTVGQAVAYIETAKA